MKICITGDSHTGALRNGQLASPDDFAEIDIRPIGAGHVMLSDFFVDHGGHIEIKADSPFRALTRIPPEPPEADYDWYGYSGPLHTQTVTLDRYFYGRRPPPLSRQLIARLLADIKRHQFAFLDALKAQGARVFVLEAPRAFAHHPKIVKWPQRAGLIEGLARGILKDMLRERGVPVVELDPSWITPDGLMDARFRNASLADKHHANAEFGRLMLARSLDLLSRAGGARVRAEAAT